MTTLNDRRYQIDRPETQEELKAERDDAIAFAKRMAATDPQDSYPWGKHSQPAVELAGPLREYYEQLDAEQDRGES